MAVNMSFAGSKMQSSFRPSCSGSTVFVARQGHYFVTKTSASHPTPVEAATPQSCSLLRSPSVRSPVVARATASTAPVAPLAPDAYICLGLAHCFEKTEEGKLVDRMVIEPISASSLECMATGARTSFKIATGTTVKAAMSRDVAALPAEFGDGVFCEKFEYRCEAAARTWLRSHAQDNLMDIVPLGKVKGKFNFSLDDKRVLNLENEVSDSDNIKQDLSIDVYGRKEKEEEAAAAAKPVSAAEKQQAEAESVEDELDALLA